MYIVYRKAVSFYFSFSIFFLIFRRIKTYYLIMETGNILEAVKLL